MNLSGYDRQEISVLLADIGVRDFDLDDATQVVGEYVVGMCLEAWERGHVCGYSDAQYQEFSPEHNPYRSK